MRRTALAAVFAFAAPLSAQTNDLRVEPCDVPGAGAARCGTLQVWENRAARSGRKIPIRFIVLPATGAATRDPVVPIAGGPGQATRDLAARVADELRELRDTRDILLVDARGTGGSNKLRCSLYGPSLAEYLGDFYPADRVRRCAAEWSGKADLGAYTTDNMAEDLDELRAALRYERLNLYGTSYGTRAALVYMRRYPRRVRASILHGVVPTGSRMPSHIAADAQRAIDGVLGECERDAACNAAYPDLKNKLRTVVERLAREPVEVTVSDPRSGEPVRLTLTRNLFSEGLRYMTYVASAASLVPAVIHQASRGDFGPAAEQALFGRRFIIDEGSHGLYLSVTCAEDLPFFEEAEAVREAQATFLGDYRVRNQKAACAAWPVRPVERSYLEPVRSDVPVLALTGQWDPATPPAQGDEAIRNLPNGRHIVVPSAGHGFDGLQGTRGCLGPLLVAFIRTADAKGLDASCVASIRRPPFPVRALATTPIAMPPAELERFTGAYTGEHGLRMEMRVRDGQLRAFFPGRETGMVAVGAATFRLLGVPHRSFTFHRDGGAVTGFTLEEGGGPPQRFTRTGSAN
ncbi:MAG TPA: alpha/beta fold hydrolase [Longimicrobium sp.]|jgi:pimeloyl-ACP methyl ester carboxylesterase